MSLGIVLLFPFFTYIGIGFVAQRYLDKSEAAQVWMDSFVFYIAMPALLFQTIIRAGHPTGEILVLLAATSAVTASLFLVSASVSRIRKKGLDPAVSGLVGAYSNIGYMGPILSVQIFGNDAGLPAAMIFCSEIVVVLTLWTVTTAGRVMSIRGIGVEIVKAVGHPFVLTVVIALIFVTADLSLATPIDATLTGLQNAAAPCALFSLGVTLARQRRLDFSLDITASILMKLVLHPVLVGVGLWPLLAHQPIWLGTAILTASLPPAANVYVLASGAGRGARQAATGVMYGTIASVVTVPLVIMFLMQKLVI